VFAGSGFVGVERRTTAVVLWMLFAAQALALT
jgi:hypothetical protein